MAEIKIEVLGGGREVGRNCFKLTFPTGEKILLDCGMKAGNGVSDLAEHRYPQGLKSLKDVNLAFLSHAHLDHVGGFPLAYYSGLKSDIVVADEITREASGVLLPDAHKLSGIFYGKPDYYSGWISYAIKRMRIGKSGAYGNVSYELIPTSHIPGGVSVLLKHRQTKSVLYAGDIRMSKTQLMDARTDLPQADILFMEGTYGNATHPNRKKTEMEFEKIILETLAQGGKILIPCFSVARMQEIILLLGRLRKEVEIPIYLDGMGKDITRIYLENAEKIDNAKLADVSKFVTLVENNMERASLWNQPAIIVPSGGMLNSPLSQYYLSNLADDRRNIVILTGHQAEGTGGRELITTGSITINKGKANERVLKPDCRVVHLSFSSHADAAEIKSLIELVNPETVIGIHGETDGLGGLEFIANDLGAGFIAPKNGDVIRI